MEIVSLLYVLCVIPIAGIIAAVIMLLKDVHKYRKSFLKRLMITALIALLLLGISLLPGQSESFSGFWIVGLPLTNLGPGNIFRFLCAPTQIAQIVKRFMQTIQL